MPANWRVRKDGFQVPPSGSVLQSQSQFRAALPEERQEVEGYYNINPMPGHVIDKVQVMYNPVFETGFENRLDFLQARSAGGFFQKKPWKNDPNIAQIDARVPGKTSDACKRLRGVVSELFEHMSQRDPQYPELHLMPLWHVTDQAAVGSLQKTGFYAAASLDAGFFGRGIYFTPDVSYAYGVYGRFHRNPVLLLSWVAAYAVYPVMEWDHLMGASQKTKHDAHFVLVRRRTPNFQDSNYDAQAPDVQNDYSEVVIFDENACLPRYVVTLKPSTTPDPGEFAFREGQRHETTASLLALYHFKRAFHCYQHAPSRGAIDGLSSHQCPHYADLWQPFTSRLVPLVKELQLQLVHSNIDRFKEELEAFSYTVNRAEGAQPYLVVADQLKAIVLGEEIEVTISSRRVRKRLEIRDLPPYDKAILLDCWNRCLFLGFTQSRGSIQPLSAQTMGLVRAIILPDKSSDSCALHEAIAFLSCAADLFDYQSKNPSDSNLVPMAQQLHKLITIATNPPLLIQALERLAELYTQHPFLKQDHRGLVILLRVLRTNLHICTLEPVVAWVQSRVAQEIATKGNQASACSWVLSLVALRFVLESLKVVSMDAAEGLLLGDTNRIGLRHWVENLVALEKNSADKTWCIQVLCTPKFLTQHFADRQEPLFQALKKSQWNFVTAWEELCKDPDAHIAYNGQRLFLRYKSLKNLPLTWQDYAELGRKGQSVNPAAAIKAYDRAKLLLEKEPNAQNSMDQLSNSLSQLYLTEGRKVAATSQIAALKFYLKALAEHTSETVLADSGDPAAVIRERLVPTALPLDDRWPMQQRLQTFARRLGAEENMTAALAAGHTVLKGIFSGVWVIEKNSPIQNQLFDGARIRTSNRRPDGSLEGRHHVACVGTAPNQLHIKENPSCPGLGFAAWSLVYLMFCFSDIPIPTGVTPAEPFKIFRATNQGIQTFCAQVSPTVSGTNFKDFLGQGTPLNTLDPLALGALTIASLLLDPEDARPANFIVEMQEGSTVGQLVSIDNDHVWVREDVFEEGILKKIRPRVKNIVYCMPHMKEPVAEALRTVFLRSPFTLLDILKMWLLGLAFYNRSLDQIFSAEERQMLFERPQDEDKVLLEAYFHPEQLGRLYLKGMGLKSALEQPQQTYFGLLRTLQLRLAILYEQVWKSQTSVNQRFEALTAGLFTSSGGTKTTNTQMVQMVLNKTLINYQEFTVHRTSPQDLIPFLQSFLGHLHHEGAIVEFVLQNLRSGYLTLFREQPDVQENVLRRLNWKSFSARVLTRFFHQDILSALGPDLKYITFKQHPLLTEEDLITLIKRLKNLKLLEVEDCPQIQCAPREGLFTKSLIALCHERGISLSLAGESLHLNVLDECQKYHGSSPLSDSIRLCPPPSWPDAVVQRFAWRYPQWGILLRLADTSKDVCCTATLTGHTDSIQALTGLPTGEIVSRSEKIIDNWPRKTELTMKTWTLQGGKWVCTQTRVGGQIHKVNCSTALPTGETVKTDRTNLMILRRQEDAFVRIQTLKGHTGQVSGLAVLPWGEIVSGSEDKTLKIWTPQSYLPLEKSSPLDSHSARLRYNLEMLLKTGCLRPEHVPLLVPKNTTALDIPRKRLGRAVAEALSSHCRQLKLDLEEFLTSEEQIFYERLIGQTETPDSTVIIFDANGYPNYRGVVFSRFFDPDLPLLPRYNKEYEDRRKIVLMSGVECALRVINLKLTHYQSFYDWCCPHAIIGCVDLDDRDAVLSVLRVGRNVCERLDHMIFTVLALRHRRSSMTFEELKEMCEQLGVAKTFVCEYMDETKNGNFPGANEAILETAKMAFQRRYVGV